MEVDVGEVEVPLKRPPSDTENTQFGLGHRPLWICSNNDGPLSQV